LIYPKISIVTPSFNQGQYLEETILSVLNQNYPNLEYILIDGGSTDNSVDLIKKYEHKLSYWVSEKDEGVYHAIQKGFERSTGDIMGWLNSDDMLHRNSLFAVAELLNIDGVEWIQGLPTSFDEYGRTVGVSAFKQWSRMSYLLHDYEWIQQESTYWKRSLWEKSGGSMSFDYKYAGDLELWNRFFNYSKLYSAPCLIGGFRLRKSGQLSQTNISQYLEEVKLILANNSISDEEKGKIYKINKLNKTLNFLIKTRLCNIPIITGKIYNRKEKLYDFPTRFQFIRGSQSFQLNK
jgi:glycosyltransferase involved in cell wall biosynthesis